VPMISKSPPTLRNSPAIDATVKELAGQTSRNVWMTRQDAAPEGKRADERTRIHAV
jgi:hypothetical protein